MLSIMLHDMQAQGVHCVADGRAALDFLEAPGNTVDVIVSDLDMPEMDGMEFIRHVAQRRRDVTIIIASRSEEHTSELQSQSNLVCRLLLEKKKIKKNTEIKNK